MTLNNLEEKNKKKRVKREIICGIYGIKATNPNSSFYNQWYIGQAVDIFDRFVKHLGKLKRNKHINPKLQSYYNKYGQDFKLFVLVECERYQLDYHEVNLINEYDSIKNGFNIVRGGNTMPPRSKKCKFRNFRTNKIEEAISIVGFARKYNLCPRTLSHVFNKKERVCGDWCNSDDDYVPKIYEFIDPNGNLHKTENLTHLANKYGLSFRGLSAVHNGDYNHHAGWRKYIDGKIYEKFEFETYKFVNTNGEIFESDNFTKFSKEMGLDRDQISKVWNDKKYKHKGWMKFKEEMWLI